MSSESPHPLPGSPLAFLLACSLNGEHLLFEREEIRRALGDAPEKDPARGLGRGAAADLGSAGRLVLGARSVSEARASVAGLSPEARAAFIRAWFRFVARYQVETRRFVN